jgi:multiple sugar transport system permease protein
MINPPNKWLLRPAELFTYIFIILLAVFTLIPFLWPIIVSFSPPPTNLTLQTPAYLTLKNFREAIWGRGGALLLLQNSLIYSLGSVLLTVLVSSLGGYTLSRLNFRFKRSFMYLVLVLQVIPITATILPYYLVILKMGMVNSYPGVILGLAAGQIPFMLWMMKGFFDAVPNELEEAAWLDGASRLEGLFRVVFPLALPGLGSGAILAFNNLWGAFFLPMIVLSSPEKFPISLGLYRAIVAYTAIDYGLMAAMAMLYMAPSFIIFLFARRYLIKGAMAGALAGV